MGRTHTHPVCRLSPTTGLRGGQSHLGTTVITDAAYGPFDQSVIFTQQLPLGAWSQTHDRGQPTQSAGAAGPPFVPGRDILPEPTMAAFDGRPFSIDPRGGTRREGSRSGLAGPQRQAGDGRCYPTAQGRAAAGPSSQGTSRPTYQHPDAEQMTPLSAISPREAAKSPGPASADI